MLGARLEGRRIIPSSRHSGLSRENGELRQYPTKKIPPNVETQHALTRTHQAGLPGHLLRQSVTLGAELLP